MKFIVTSIYVLFVGLVLKSFFFGLEDPISLPLTILLVVLAVINLIAMSFHLIKNKTTPFLIWLLVMFFFNWVAALVYYHLVYGKRQTIGR